MRSRSRWGPITSSSRSANGSLRAHARQHVLDDPAVDPGQERFGLAIDQGLHQHQRGTQKEGQQGAVKRDLEGRGHAGQVVQEGVEVLDQRQAPC